MTVMQPDRARAKCLLCVREPACCARRGSACERNWSLYEWIHNKKRNSLSVARAEKLVRSPCNLNLINKHHSAAADFVPWMDEMVVDDPAGVIDVSDPEDDAPTASPVGVRAHPRRQSPRLSEALQQTQGGHWRGHGKPAVAAVMLPVLHANLFGFY